MTSRNKHDDDDDDHPRILRDGERVRVPMMMRDSWRNEMAAYFARRDGCSVHRRLKAASSRLLCSSRAWASRMHFGWR
jgi:hypothetical protein